MKTKITVKQKILFIFLLVLGNAVMALLTLSGEPEDGPVYQAPIVRQDYVNIRVAAILRAELNPQKPVTLLGNKSKQVLVDAFVLKKFERSVGPEDFMGQKNEVEYLVSVPKAQAKKALGEETFSIYPNGLEIRSNKRKNYEVLY